jgi:hypothetical protein
MMDESNLTVELVDPSITLEDVEIEKEVTGDL